MLQCSVGRGGREGRVVRLLDTLHRRLKKASRRRQLATCNGSSNSSCKRNRLKINFPFHRQCDKECVCVRMCVCVCVCAGVCVLLPS